MAQLRVLKENPTTVLLGIQCPKCGKLSKLTVTKEAMRNWQGGMFIQNAFPTKTPDERELLMSGFCSKCWNDIFGPEEDEEEMEDEI